MAKKLEYNVNTDYKAIMDKAISDGDLELAAEAEALRNRKIDETGSSYEKTFDFIKSPLEQEKAASKTTNSQHTTTTTTTPSASSGNQYIGVGTYNDKGLSAADKEQILIYQRGYEDAKLRGDTKAMDEYHRLAEAIRAQYGYSGGIDGSEFLEIEDDLLDASRVANELNSQKPTYSSKYKDQIDQLLNQILNREDFSYDAAKDPLYQQYEQMFRREGERTTQDTLADLATSAGGMNSYAVTAAQQAGNYYNSQLSDKIPELYQLAYEMYLNDKASDVQDLGLLTNMDDSQYNRYRDTMSDYYNDRDFAYNAYLDDYNSKWQNKEWQASQDATNLGNQRYDTETAKSEVWTYIELGVMPSADLIAKAGMTEEEVALAVESIKADKTAEQNKTNTSNQQTAQKQAREDVWKYIELGVMPSDDLIARAGMNKTDVALAIESVAMGGGVLSGGENEIDFSGTNPTESDYLMSGLTGLNLNQSQNETLQDIQAIVEVGKILDEIAKTDGKQAAYSALQELEGTINKTSYDALVAKYKP